MKRISGRWGVALACLCLIPLSASMQPARAAGPNVLFLLADDMRADSIGALGNPTVKTATLDALVRRGFVFANACNLGGNVAAVCTPSRNMLFSGKAYFRWRDHRRPGDKPQRNGLLAPGDGPDFPLSLKASGHLTYHHGVTGLCDDSIVHRSRHRPPPKKRGLPSALGS